MEMFPRPDDVPDYAWATENTDKIYVNPAGQVWVGKLTAGGTVFEYDAEDAAITKMDKLFDADSTNRRYKVVEI